MSDWTGTHGGDLHVARANGGVGLAVDDSGVLLEVGQVADLIDTLIDLYDEIRAEKEGQK